MQPRLPDWVDQPAAPCPPLGTTAQSQRRLREWSSGTNQLGSGLRLLCLIAFVLFTQNQAFAATTYSVVDLGTLGGNSFGTAISESGNGTGYSLLGGGQTHAFYWTPGGGMVDIGNLGGGDSHGYDISDDNIVGDTTGQAFRWTPGTGMVLIDSANTGSANGLNASKAAIGERDVTGGAFRVRTWTSSDVAGNPYPVSNFRGVAINDNGEFVSQAGVGSSGMYSPGTGPFTSLGIFSPTDIDNNRLITGSLGGIAAVLDFDTNTTTMLGKLSPTDTFSNALGISPNGTIVGVSQGTGAFIADSTTLTMQNLTSLLDAGFVGWTILSATDVNTAGQIIGVGEFNGVTRAVILTPVPEPSGIVMGCIAVLSIFGGRCFVSRCRQRR